MNLFNLFFLVLLLVFSSGKTCAEFKTIENILEENKGSVVLINHFSQDLYLSSNLKPDESRNFLSFSNLPLSPKIILYSPLSYSRNLSVSIGSLSFDIESAAIEVEVLNLQAEEFYAFRKFITYFHKLKNKQGKIEPAAIHKLKEKLHFGEQFDSYIKTITFESHIKAGEWQEAWQQLKLLEVSPAVSIARQCTFLDRFLSSSNSLRQDLQLEAIGKLAFELYVYWAHHGKLLDNGEAELGLNSYKSLCRPVIEKIASEAKVPLILMQEVSPNNETQESWSIRSDANILFEYILTRIPINNKRLASKLLQYLWLYFNFNNKHAVAEKSARDGIQLWNSVKNNKDFTLLAELYNSIFISLLRQGAFSEALKFTSKGIGLAGRIHKSSEWRMYFNMALLNTYIGEFDVAKRYYQRALSVHSKNYSTQDDFICQMPLFNQHQVGYSTAMIGAMDRELANYSQAQMRLECGEKILRTSNSNHQYVAQVELAKLAITNKNFEQAITYADLVLDGESSLVPQKLDAIILKGTAVLKSKNDKNSRQYLETLKTQLAFLFKYQDLNIPPQNFEGIIEYPVRQIQAFHILMNYYHSLGQKEKAQVYAEAAIKLAKKYTLSLHNPQAWNSARFKFIQSYVGTLIDDKNRNVEKLFSILETHYSLLPALEKNIYAIANEDAFSEEPISQSYREWLGAERNLATVLAEDKEKPQYQADSAKAGFLSHQTVKKHTKPAAEHSLSLRSAQQNMSENDILLRYFADSENTYVFILTNRNAEVRLIGSSKDLYEELHRILNSQSAGTGITSTLNISRKLLPMDLIKNVQYNKLVIIPDGLLHRLSFSALDIPRNENRNDPLIDYTQVVSTTSASSYYVNKDSRGEPLSITLFSAPITSRRPGWQSNKPEVRQVSNKKYFPYLPGINRETNEIIKMFNTVNLRLGIQEEATNQFLMSEQARSSRVLHIAAHGYYDPHTPDVVGLITSGQGVPNLDGQDFLSLSELLSKPVSSDLVVISGCDTHQGKYYKGSGLRSMTRGFLTQGAGSVMGTLWSVEDQATANFMILFYQNLKKYHNSAKALQETKKHMAKQIRYRHPKYWAGFVLTVASRQYETINLN